MFTKIFFGKHIVKLCTITYFCAKLDFFIVMAKLTFEAVLKILTTICNILLVAIKMITGSDVPDEQEN